MFGRRIALAIRNLQQEKLYTLLNMGGLAIGLAAALLLFSWVKDEMSFDRFHQKGKDIVVVNNFLNGGDGDIQTFQTGPAPIYKFSLNEIPEVENAALIKNNYNYTIYESLGKTFSGDVCMFVEPSFFKVFDFPVIDGNAKNPLPNPNSVVLTEEMAHKFFGDKDPIGQIIKADKKEAFVVSAVIKNFPSNSSLRYDLLFSMDHYRKLFGGNGDWKTVDEDWGSFDFLNYLQLKPGADYSKVERKLAQLIVKHNKYVKEGMVTFKLQPLEKMHLYKADGTPGLIRTVKVFFMVAIILLILASINYVNLATARATRRAKEVSVRKVNGATRGQLIGQFLLESSLMLLGAFVVACGLIVLLRPMYEKLTGKVIQAQMLDGSMIQILILTFLGTLAAVGIYPAIFLSSFEPITALKGKFSFGGSNKNFRNTLVVLQFASSIVLIVSTIVITNQLKYIQQKDLGFDKDYVFTLPAMGMYEHLDAVRNELASSPAIKSLSTASDNLVSSSNSTGDTDWDGKDPNRLFVVHPIGADKDFVKNMHLSMIEGEAFKGAAADSNKFLLNETAVRLAGIQNPVGKRFKLWQTEGIIAGVVKDFHNVSLRSAIEPAVFYYSKDNWKLYVKTSGENASAAIAAVEKQWKRYNPNFPFTYQFLDDEFNSLYQTEQRTGQLFNAFAGIAILISVLGLFGLATYIAQRRIKEIGIRKTLGASVESIVSMLAKDFIRLVLVAFVLATPLAWWLMNKWLKNFAYRVDLEWWHFALAGVLAVAVAFLTVSMQSVRAALSNPVKSLRSE